MNKEFDTVHLALSAIFIFCSVPVLADDTNFSMQSKGESSSNDVQIAGTKAILSPEASQKEAILKLSKFISTGDYKAANETFIANRPVYNSQNVIAYTFRKAFERRQQQTSGDKDFFANCQSLLQQKNFDELDRIYDDLLASKKISLDGFWYIDHLLDSLCSAKNKDADQQWLDQIALLKEWSNKKPESVPAKVALAKTWIDYGWKARGGDVASRVSTASFAMMGERLRKAEKVLNDVSVHSPIWYHVSQKLALGQQWPKAEYEKMFQECRKDFPTYYPAVFSHYWRLQPRWYGKAGEAKAYLEDECGKLPESDGKILYARTACTIQIDVVTMADKFLGLDWAPAKSGMLELIKQNRSWYLGRALYSALALQAGDADAASSAFEIYPE